MVTRTDIANRALQRCGQQRLAAGTLFTSLTNSATEIAACYDGLREAELRRNVWRFSIRNIPLRAVDTDTRKVTFPAYDAAKVYLTNSVVLSAGLLWYSALPDKIADFAVTVATPAVFALTAHGLVAGTPVIFSTTGALPTGLLADTVYYVIAAGLTADAFEVSATLAGSAVNTSGTQSGTHSLTGGLNIAHTPSDDTGTYWTRYFGPITATLHDTETTYTVGELVYDTSSVVYLSLAADNDDVPPTANWRILTGATLAPLNLIYPAGCGPLSQTSSRNVFVLPNGFMREAPQDPSAGKSSCLGYPSNLPLRDWNFESNLIVTREAGMIILRFAANVGDPTLFDAMFVEGLAARIAEEVVERLTQSAAKVVTIQRAYKEVIGEARIVNGIEVGSVAPPLDDYLACRA
jgi:hypothetical protein